MDPLLATAFTMGLMGGVHCMGMCGGIVGALSLGPRRASAFVLLGYNAGRIAAYAAGGALAGLAGSVGSYAANIIPAQTVLFVLANALVVLLGLHLAGAGGLVLRLEAAGAALWRGLRPLGLRFAPADTPARALGLGLVWGWIPCGLVYSALALALAGGDAFRGAGVMLAFGVGTLPNLLAAGWAARRLRAALQPRWVRVAVGLSVVSLGLWGLARVPGLAQAVFDGLHCIVA